MELYVMCWLVPSKTSWISCGRLGGLRRSGGSGNLKVHVNRSEFHRLTEWLVEQKGPRERTVRQCFNEGLSLNQLEGPRMVRLPNISLRRLGSLILDLPNAVPRAHTSP